MDNGLTKAHTKSLYGLAILLMLYHHLFGFPERINDSYFSIIDAVGGGNG